MLSSIIFSSDKATPPKLAATSPYLYDCLQAVNRVNCYTGDVTDIGE